MKLNSTIKVFTKASKQTITNKKASYNEFKTENKTHTRIINSNNLQSTNYSWGVSIVTVSEKLAHS